MIYFLNMVTGEVYTDITVQDNLKELNGEDIKCIGYYGSVFEATKDILRIWKENALKELAIKLFVSSRKYEEYFSWRAKYDVPLSPIDDYLNGNLEFEDIKDIIDNKYLVLCLMLLVDGFDDEEYRYEAWSKLYCTKITEIEDIICIRKGICP